MGGNQTNRRHREEALRAQITDALIRDVGVSERMAQPFVDSVMGCFAGQKPYFPALERDYPVLHIRAALENGKKPGTVCREFGISRRTLNNLFPGGLPRSIKEAA